MKKRTRLIFIFVLCAIFLIYFGIEQKETFLKIKESITKEYQIRKAKHDLFGRWRIDRVAMISEMYTGTTLDGVDEEQLFEAADYIGYELEYSSKFIRIGEEKYENPIYEIWIEDEKSVQNLGKFFPNVYMVIEEEGIEVDYYTIPLISIEFEQEITFQKYNFIPVGAQCILFDKNTLLLGFWGKIVLAHRIEE